MSRLGRAARLGAVLAAFLLAGMGAFTCARADELVFEIKIANGQVPEPMRLIRVKQGDTVRLKWATDRTLVLHLHGYDIEKRVVSGRTTEMAFTAKATGRFAVEIHAHAGGGQPPADAPLLYVEVYPR